MRTGKQSRRQMQIIKDEKFLRQISEPATPEEGREIGEKLLQVLSEHEDGIGLSAPQIGILKRVVAIKVKDKPFYLVNPRIIEAEGEIVYSEGCLSFPGKTARTIRHTLITVEADNWLSKMIFCPITGENEFSMNDSGLLECICVQHEIAHLDGKLMIDFFKTIKNPFKYGRNEKVNIKNNVTDQVIEQIKYKKAEAYLEQGWEIV